VSYIQVVLHFQSLQNMEPHCSATNGLANVNLASPFVSCYGECLHVSKLSFGLWVVNGFVAYSFLMIVVNEGTTLSEVVC
jgi:hypothetical protein